ncbi:hemagglutinin repeat-containing protein [Burkholderia plantarii]|uniref:hemagglutinin repeat-containing protein n=1 Tax=Burkholderia plantarii TaxID=41899 RepID=UPI00209B4CCF|nr:hemagglutinin repeat-containing protein [Burkholderia plantarii]
MSAGAIDNTGGVLATQALLGATLRGGLVNANGRLSSGTALSLTAGGALDNIGGVIGAGGAVADSALGILAASIDNSDGAITNAGTGQTWIDGGSQIVNRHAGGVAGMGSISGNGDTMVTATSVSNTQGGQLGGGNLHVHGANLDNTGGQIGNVANATGNVDVSMTGSIGNSGGTIGSTHDLALSAYAVGGGTYSAGGNLSLSQQADFATSTAYRFSAGRTLSFTLPGNFGNNIGFVAANDLSINAGAIWNTGSIAAGGVLSTHGATLDNTGTLVGASVVITAGQSISNRGASALIGATSSTGLLALMAPDIENRDDSTVGDSSATTAIYGLGQVILAGGQDANGNFYNAGVIRNQSGLIQSGGDMLIEANLVTNTRRAMGVSGLMPLDPAYVESLGISLAGRTGQANHPDPNSIGGVYIDPPHGGSDNSDYLYTDYTGVASGSVVNYVTPKSQIISGGNLNAYSVGTLQNYWSQVAAVGNLGSPQSIDQDSWRGQTAPQIVVTYSGVYTYRTYKGRMWGYDFCDGNAICKAPADVRTYAMPASGAYESTFTAGGTLSGTGVTINNTAGNAGLLPPPALQASQTAQSDRAQSVGGTLGGGQGGSAVATGAVSGAVDSATAARSIGASAIHDTIDAGATGHDLSVGAVGGAVQTGAAGQTIGAGAVSGSVASGTGRQAIDAGTVSGSIGGGGASGRTVAADAVSGSIANGGGSALGGAAAASGTIGSGAGGVQVGAAAASGTIGAAASGQPIDAGTVSGTIATGGGRDITAGAVSGAIVAGGAAPQVAAGSVSGSVTAGSSGVQVGANAASGTVAGGLPATSISTQGGHVASGGVGAAGRTNVANATAPAVLSNITLPAGGLFSVATAPQTPYLIETNPAFTSAQQWLSSDYYFQQTGMDPSKIQLRLGDGFYEQKLVQDQIMAMTGKAVLTNYADTQAEYQALMTSGAALAKALDLAPGTGLSPEQVAQLTSNVVIMQTQVVDGKTVLVPVVYLAQASQQDMGNGPLIAATNIDLQNAVTVNNSGTISASNDFSISSQRIDSSFGTLQSGGNMSLVSGGDINLTSATVNAGSLQLKAGGNLVLDSAVNTLNQSGNGGATRTTTSLGPLASINVSGDASITAGGNFEQNAGSLNVGGALGLNVGGDWTLGVQQTGESQLVYRHGGVSDTNFSIDTGSSVKVGGASAIVVGGDLSATGANLNLGGGGAIVVGGNLNLQAAVATSTIDSNSSGSESRRSYAEARHVSDDAVTATTLTGGDSLTLAAGKDINVLGSTVSLDQGAAQLVAGGNVTIGAVTETHVDDSQETHSHSGVASSTKVASSRDTTTILADGSTISADSVVIASGKDIGVTGSTIVGTHDVDLVAKGNVSIAAATDSWQDTGFYQEKHSGLSASGGLGFTIGSSEQSDHYNGSSVTQSQSRSTVGSVAGNVVISAAADVHVSGSDVVAGKAVGDVTGTTGNIGISGRNVTIDPGQDSAQSHDQQEAHSSGLTVAITGTPLDTVRNVRADASSGTGFQRGQSVLTELGASALDIPSISVSYGSSKSSSTTDASSLTNSGSTIRAGGNVTVTATGGALLDANGRPIDGDLTVLGSTISAGGTTALTANRNVDLLASTDQLRQSTEASSSSTGISLATPSAGDWVRWIGGTANNGGTSPSPYNASRSSSDGTQAQTTQTASVISGNSVVVASKTGDINVIGSGISGTRGVDLAASEGAINVLAGLDTSVSHQESSSKQIGSLGGNGTATGFSVGVASSHSVQDVAAQTQSTMRSQIVSGQGDVTIDARQNITVAGADLGAGKDLTLIGKNVILDPGTDASQSSASQSSSQFGVSLALGGAVGNAVATINQSMNNASHAGDARLAALDTAQAGLAAYNAYQVASAAQPSQALVKATVSVGGGSSHSESQSSTLANDGSTLHAGDTVSVIATGSGAKDVNGFAADGDINARGTQISGQNVVLNAARDINLQSARDTSQQSSSNSSSGGSIGIGASLGGQQNGFTLELGASASRGDTNGQSVTNRDTEVSASNTLTTTSGRDTNLRGAEVSGNTVDANVGRDLTIQSPQDTSTYDSKRSSAGFQASICVPPFCFGQTVSGSASVGQTKIDSNYQSVNQQSGIYAGSGGYDINVGNHTQLDGGVLASAASADKNSLSTQTLGYTNLENHASYSGNTVGVSVSGGFGNSTTGGVKLDTPVKQGPSNTAGPLNSQGLGPSGFSAAGTGSSASGTTYAAISAGTITVRGDAGTGHDSTAGLSRDTTTANGSVQNGFDAQKVQDDLAIQQGVGQVGMQVVGDVASALESRAAAKEAAAATAYRNAQQAGDQAGMAQALSDYTAAQQQLALWSNDGAARIAAHAGVAAIGAAAGGGSMAGAVAGTVAGDVAGNAVTQATGDTLGSALLSNVASGLAGAAAGVAAGGSAGAVSGASGALSADLYNRQLHPDEKALIHAKADGDAAEEKRLTEAACYAVQCWAQYSPNSPEWLQNYVSPQDAAGLNSELAWVNSEKVPGGLFDYTLGQQAKDIGLSQWDQFSRGARQLGQDVLNLPHDLVNSRLNIPGDVQQGDANPLVDVTNGGNGTPPTATAVVTPAPCPVGPGACGMVVTPVISPGTPILSSGNGGNDDSGGNQASDQNASSGSQQATNTSGDAARLVGQSRETTVANIVNGSISGEQVAVPVLGSTDIDVVAANGNLIAVGGPAKANNLGKLGQELRIYQAIADQRGVSAQAYFAEGTPQSAINLATKILGEGNVKIFPGSK